MEHATTVPSWNLGREKQGETTRCLQGRRHEDVKKFEKEVLENAARSDTRPKR